MKILGILNLTPDSFSDGGRNTDPQALADLALQWSQAGVAGIDLGAESTRPNATPLGWEEEWQRLAPTLHSLRNTPLPPDFILSIDTRHAETAERALDLGAHWINDVTALASPAMRRLLARHNTPIVIMHSLTVPVQPHITLPPNCDPLEAILHWATERTETLAMDGIAPERLILDPGLGFGKTLEQNWRILRESSRLSEIGLPVLIGHSRKSLLSRLTPAPASDRDLETLGLSLALAQHSIQWLRVHAAPEHVRALRAFNALTPPPTPEPTRLFHDEPTATQATARILARLGVTPHH